MNASIRMFQMISADALPTPTTGNGDLNQMLQDLKNLVDDQNHIQQNLQREANRLRGGISAKEADTVFGLADALGNGQQYYNALIAWGTFLTEVANGMW